MLPQLGEVLFNHFKSPRSGSTIIHSQLSIVNCHRVGALDGNLFYEQEPAATLNGPPRTLDDVAREVLAGQWSAGDQRKAWLTAAGYDYKAVQAEVNKRVG